MTDILAKEATAEGIRLAHKFNRDYAKGNIKTLTEEYARSLQSVDTLQRDGESNTAEYEYNLIMVISRRDELSRIIAESLIEK